MCYKFYVPEHQEMDFLDEILGNLLTRNVAVKTGNVTPPAMLPPLLPTAGSCGPSPLGCSGATAFQMASWFTTPAAKPPPKSLSLPMAWLSAAV